MDRSPAVTAEIAISMSVPFCGFERSGRDDDARIRARATVAGFWSDREMAEGDQQDDHDDRHGAAPDDAPKRGLVDHDTPPDRVDVGVADLSKGSVILNLVPAPKVLWTPISPPCACTISRTMESPSPTPVSVAWPGTR